MRGGASLPSQASHPLAPPQPSHPLATPRGYVSLVLPNTILWCSLRWICQPGFGLLSCMCKTGLPQQFMGPTGAVVSSLSVYRSRRCRVMMSVDGTPTTRRLGTSSAHLLLVVRASLVSSIHRQRPLTCIAVIQVDGCLPLRVGQVFPLYLRHLFSRILRLHVYGCLCTRTLVTITALLVRAGGIAGIVFALLKVCDERPELVLLSASTRFESNCLGRAYCFPLRVEQCLCDDGLS